MPATAPSFERRHDIRTDRPTVAVIGRVAFEKNIGFLLDVLTRVRQTLPEVLLIIAGEGPARRALEQRAAHLRLQENTIFVGYLSRNGPLMDCYCAADAFVFASRTETQGLVLLEAMALGVPVVSTAVMGTGDVLREGEGAVIAQEDVGDFADKVLRVLCDGALRRELSAAGRRYAERWSAGACARRMLDLYRRLIEQGPGVTAPRPPTD